MAIQIANKFYTKTVKTMNIAFNFFENNIAIKIFPGNPRFLFSKRTLTEQFTYSYKSYTMKNKCMLCLDMAKFKMYLYRCPTVTMYPTYFSYFRKILKYVPGKLPLNFQLVSYSIILLVIILTSFRIATPAFPFFNKTIFF